MSEIKLLDCPFCGSDKIQLLWMLNDIPGVQEEDVGDGADGPAYANYYIECRGCAFTSNSYASSLTITEKWNTRTAIREPVGADEQKHFWWCPECKAEVDGSNVTYDEHHDTCGAYVTSKCVNPEPVGMVDELIKRVARAEAENIILNIRIRVLEKQLGISDGE